MKYNIVVVILLTIFISLKLTSVILWSWIWVLSPLWLPFSFILFIVMSIYAIAIMADLINRLKQITHG